MEFPNQNSTDFPISVKNNLNQVAKTYNAKDFLRYHQFMVYNYLIKNNDNRGLLLFHEMGMGKSITATALAEYYREYDPDRNIVILLSKSLQANFKKNIHKYMMEHDQRNKSEKMSDSQIDDIIDSKYKFISLNASNMFTQITRIKKTKEELQLEKQLEELANIVEKDDFLENSLLIIDEYHNLSNSITNGSYNAIRLYDTIMKTKNIKMIFLTGTPIVNNPFELAPTFNMLKGYINLDKYGKIKVPLFPELKKDFYKFFVDRNKNKIKNKNRFENRILGMVSYYGSMYLGNKQQEGFPKELETIIERVCMSSEQFSVYDAARDLEKEESLSKGNSRQPAADRFASKSSVSSSYRVKSRQISNFLIPDYALTHKGKKIIKHIDKISDSYIKNLNVASPKFKKILNNIEKHSKTLGLFYSEFVSGEGIALFAKVLTLNGYSSWNKALKFKEDEDVYDLNLNKKQKTKGGGAPTKTYAIISGDVDFETRSKIVKIFNSDDNINGSKILLLLISKTGAEGLDLKNVRHIHICEPYWNMARLDQIIARGVRYLSHKNLPLKNRNVQPYVYLSDYPKNYPAKKKKEETTDIELYTEAKKSKILIMQFYIALIEASVDCTAHEAKFPKSVKDMITCKMCSPTNNPLYNNNLYKDLHILDPCEKLKQTTLKAKEINIDGVKYYYTEIEGPIKEYHIFKYDSKVNGYVPLQSHEVPYSDIIKHLLAL
jgi:superfamily II DNA or RNA helicase